MAGTKTILKWHGGKSDLASRYWDVARPLDWRPIHVVEPYCGGASFTLKGLARDLPYSFVINDLSRDLTNFWRVLQCPTMFHCFQRQIEATPFSEWEFKHAERSYIANDLPDATAAAAFFIRNRQSLAGRMKGFTGITKTRVRRRMNNEVSAWLSTVDDLPWFHSLLRKVLILDARPALEVIRKHDTPHTLFFVDPPYVHSTRSTSGEYGAHELTNDDHVELCHTLSVLKGKFLLCGYDNTIYEAARAAFGWQRRDFQINNHAAGGKTKEVKTECLWTNL